MNIEEKQIICKNILKKLINLRATMYDTKQIYMTCHTIITNAWDKDLAEFIDNKFYNPVIEKYSELYKKNCVTFSSVPLRIKSPYKMSMVSPNNITIFTVKDKTPTALLWCGLGLAEVNNYTELESATLVKLQDPTEGNERILYCKTPHVLEPYNFVSLVHLLKNGTHKEEKSCLSKISLAFLNASIKLKDFSFRIKLKNKIKISNSTNKKDFEILEEVLNSNKVKTEIKKLEEYDSKMYHYDYSLMIEKLYEDLNLDIKPFSNTDFVNKYDKKNDRSYPLDFIIDLTSVTKFIDANKRKNSGPVFWFGENARGIMGRYKSSINANFVSGLVVAYIVLMSDITDEGLKEIERIIPEAKKQYLSYLNTMSTITASFNAQILSSYL